MVAASGLLLVSVRPKSVCTCGSMKFDFIIVLTFRLRHAIGISFERMMMTMMLM